METDYHRNCEIKHQYKYIYGRKMCQKHRCVKNSRINNSALNFCITLFDDVIPNGTWQFNRLDI